MDMSECVSVETTLDDELDFFHFALSDPNVRLVLLRATINGPTFAALQDWPAVHLQEFSFLWNSRCSNPLCWRVRLPFQDIPKFPPIGEQTKQTFVTAHEDFKKIPISEEHFANGGFHGGLSPVVEVSKGGYLIASADFSDLPRHDLWIAWDPEHDMWIYENRDIEEMYEVGFRQPRESLQWQDSLIEWIYTHWWDKINRHSSWSYRYNDMANLPASWPLRQLRRRGKAYLHRLGMIK